MSNKKIYSFFALAMMGLSYIIGCLTIKYELFPYNLYKSQFIVGSQPEVEFHESEPLFNLIKKGGYVIQFRHTHRNRLAIPVIPASVDLNYSCLDGANLTTLGIEQAKWIKINIERNNIPVGEIHSSPACRLRQMNEIIFPEKDITYSDFLLYDRILTKDQVIQKKIYLNLLLTKPIPNSTNRFIMGHQGTYHPKGYDLPEGHAFIYKPIDDKSFTFLGAIELVTWLP